MMKNVYMFALLMMLLAVSWAQTTSPDLTTITLNEEFNKENDGIIENVEYTTSSGDGEIVAAESTENEESIDTESDSIVSITAESSPTDSTNTESETSNSTTVGDATELNNAEGTTAETDEELLTTTTTASDAPTCTEAGKWIDQNDCHKYYECSSEGSENGTLNLYLKSCGDKEAFSTKLNRCSRDISSCPLPIQCARVGNLADPTSNTSYYNCFKLAKDVDFYVFRIDCESTKYYEPLVSSCMWNITQINIGLPLHTEIKDADIVGFEKHLIQKEYKLELKRLKEEQKAKKAEAKKAAKLKKQNFKAEVAAFVCEEEGLHSSQFIADMCIACIVKKDKIKAVSQPCLPDTTINP